MLMNVFAHSIFMIFFQLTTTSWFYDYPMTGTESNVSSSDEYTGHDNAINNNNMQCADQWGDKTWLHNQIQWIHSLPILAKVPNGSFNFEILKNSFTLSSKFSAPIKDDGLVSGKQASKHKMRIQGKGIALILVSQKLHRRTAKVMQKTSYNLNIILWNSSHI